MQHLEVPNANLIEKYSVRKGIIKIGAQRLPECSRISTERPAFLAKGAWETLFKSGFEDYDDESRTWEF